MAKKTIHKKAPGDQGPIRFRGEIVSTKKPVMFSDDDYRITLSGPNKYEITSRKTSILDLRDSDDNNSITDIKILFSESFTLEDQAYRARWNLKGLVSYVIDPSVKFGYQTSFATAFQGCTSLTTVTIPLECFDTDPSRGLKETNNMFSGCTALETIDMSGWVSSYRLADVSQMFQGCTSLKNVTMMEPTLNRIARTNSMFEGCTDLVTLSIPWIENSIFTAENMFRDCTSLVTLDLSTWELYNSGLTNAPSNYTYKGMFKGCTSLVNISMPTSGNFNSIYDISELFYKCHSLVNVDMSSLKFDKPVEADYMFYDCSALESVKLYNMQFYPPKGNINNMFRCCGALICVNNMNTKSATSYNQVFGIISSGCTIPPPDPIVLQQPDEDAVDYIHSASGDYWKNANACP